MTGGAKNLARMERVDVREIWKNEAPDFTPWLAEPENLQLLGDTLGMALEDPRTEQSVGSFAADVVATNTANGRRVLVENQLEGTDHAHLGQILTYAAGLDALTVVWIAKKFTDEHRAALEWLNNHTNTEIGFFGLEIEVWKIGDSRPAPRFNIVAKPNDWKKTLPGKREWTKTQQAQYDFWSGFCSYAATRDTKFQPTAPLRQNWMNIAIGKTGFRLVAAAASASVWSADPGKAEIRAEFIMDSEDAGQHFEALKAKHDEINGAFPSDFCKLPVWRSEEGVRQRKVYFQRTIDWSEQANRDRCYGWLVEKLNALYDVFRPRIQNLS